MRGVETTTVSANLQRAYRWELRHLLARRGFALEAGYSDFACSPPAYGKELVVVARPGPRTGERS